jgi:predicted Rdx family selenoprotein
MVVTRVEIEFCGPCRYGEQAAATRRVLLSRLRTEIDPSEVGLTPRREPCLCVAVDGERVWCAADPGGRVDAMAAVNAVRRRLAG